MSATTQVALLSPRTGPQVSARRRPAESGRAGTLVPVAAFAALGLYGTVRWATLLSGSPDYRRLFGLFGVSLVLAVAGALLLRRARRLLMPLAVLAVVAVFPLSGVPLDWVIHVRLAVTARAIGDGIDALPGILLPYQGFNQWVRVVMVLGAGLLVVDAALMLALASRSASIARRAVAALPLIALVVIPTLFVHPRFEYLSGALLFGLLAVFLWGDRIPRQQAGSAAVLCAAAAIGAMVIAPAIHRPRPWLDYQHLAAPGAAPAESFDWTQSYGPIVWPRDGRTVLQVQASRPDYWKAASLDVFNGRAWAEGSFLAQADAAPGVPRATLARFTQTLKVTLGSIRTDDVIAAGVATPPVGVGAPLQAGASPGTWISLTPLTPGDTYFVRVYDPRPTPAELRASGTAYPRAIVPAYLSLIVPSKAGTTAGVQQLIIPPFRSAPRSAHRDDLAAALDRSPYAGAYDIATRLAATWPTPYAFVLAVERLLSTGYVYSENPPAARYPLESFLIDTKQGYCQQFAGALALLLRLGGVPARVAVGFTTGRYDGATKRWVVTDQDAHAWVEAFFPGYGWVRFEPTPPADPALGGHLRGTPIGAFGAQGGSATHRRPELATPTRSRVRGQPRAGTSSGAGVAMWIAIAAAIGALVLAALLLRPLHGLEERLAELERAFARTGRPLTRKATLASLEWRLRDSPSAADYVRSLRLQRFGGGGPGPTIAQRRAVRRALARGLGPGARLRCLWALPPRWGR
jgi:transglutaminase-like putative cysteine protease